MINEIGQNSTGSDESDEENMEVLRLTDMVRKQYMSFLKKQLELNAITWGSVKMGNGKGDTNMPSLLNEEGICKCAERLEDKAIKACMVAKLYQRAMVKIIAEVRHHTKEQRLEGHLHELIREKESFVSSSHFRNKATQTEINAPKTEYSSQIEIKNEQYSSLTLEQKIDIFQKRLNKEDLESKKNSLLQTKSENCNCHRRQRKRSYAKISPKQSEQLNNPLKQTMRLSISSSPTATPPLQQIINNAAGSPIHLELKLQIPAREPVEQEYQQEDDNIAKELAQLFSEEKTELDELFGIDPNDDTDDPQISSILKEIANSKLPHEYHTQPVPNSDQPKVLEISTTTANSPLATANDSTILKGIATSEPQQLHEQQSHTSSILQHSLWPCELYMQRRRLTASLNRLIEEDFRWHELMKWKFNALFGDDSDDEFAGCSPSIELDEVLIGSCVRRISPWMVKHLMQPLDDGLIANRFLFKKLAKKLARSIIMEHQYPDERVIKRAVENFFCLHQAVMSIDDIRDIPNISFNDDI